jgi:hypothetical protein
MFSTRSRYPCILLAPVTNIHYIAMQQRHGTGTIL